MFPRPSIDPPSTDGVPRGRWVWPLLLAGAVFAASSRGEVAAPAWPHIDKVAHALVFGLLATLVARTQPARRYWLGVLVAAVYGVADEARQSLSPGRSVELADWAADTLGATVAVVAYALWGSYRRLLERPLQRRPDGRIAFWPRALPDKAA